MTKKIILVSISIILTINIVSAKLWIPRSKIDKIDKIEMFSNLIATKNVKNNTISATVNGKQLSDDNAICALLAADKGYLSGKMGNDYITIYFPLNATVGRTYNRRAGVGINGMHYVTSKALVTVTAINGNRIEGTFTFTALNDSNFNDKVVVTNGKFSTNYSKK